MHLKAALKTVLFRTLPVRPPAAFLDGVFALGYWDLPNNQKRDKRHYERHARDTLRLLRGSRVVLFSDSDWFCALARGSVRADRLTTVRLAAEKLPAWENAGRLLGAWGRQDTAALAALYAPGGRFAGLPAHEEKGLVHHRRDFEGSGPDVSRRLLSIWLSKLDLAEQALALCGDNSSHVGWADASLGRFNFLRPRWDVRRARYKPAAVHHFASRMRCDGAPLPLNASFLFGDTLSIQTCATAFHRILQDALGDAYCHDEETLLARVLRAQPGLFHAL